MKKKFLLKVIALSLVLINLLSIVTPAVTELVPGKHAEGIKNENKEINYVSLGDSMSNGFVLPGYEKGGYLEVAKDAYPARFSAWLSGFEGEIANGQTKFEGSKGTVNLTQLATSGMRSEDLHYILEYGMENGQKPDSYTYDTLIDSGRWHGNYYEVFKKAITEADIISMAIGNANMGVYMLAMIEQALGIEDHYMDISYATVENALKLVKANEEIELIAMDTYYKALDYLEGYMPREKANAVAGVMVYCITSFLVNYEGALDRIAEFNPDAEIIIMGVFNTFSKSQVNIVYEGKEYTVSFEKLMRVLLEPINVYLMNLASSKKNTPEYKDITFYYSEIYDMQTLSATFNSEYEKEDALWFLSRFVPDITESFFPLFVDKLGLTDITYNEVYRYYFERESFLASLGGLGEEAKNTKIYSIEIYKILERAICEAIPLVPYFDFDALGIKIDEKTDLTAIASAYTESFFDSIAEDVTPEELLAIIKNDATVVSLLSLYGRISLANGIAGHPCVDDHKKIFETLAESYLKGKSAEYALEEKLKELFSEGMITNYYKNEDSRYLAIGNKGSVDMGEHYSALLADKLDIEYEFLDKADLRISDLLALFDEEYINDKYGNALMSQYDIEALREKYADAIKASDLITLDFGVDDFRGFITDQMMGYIVETYNDKFTTIKALSDKLNIGFPDMTGYKTYEMDFTRFEEIISEEEIDKILDKVRETVIEQGVPEEYELIIPLSDILGVESPMLKKLEIVFDLYPVDMTVYLAECYLYAAINYAYNYTSVIEQIRAINPDAEIVVLGGINAFNKLQLSMGEDIVDLSMIGNAAVLALDGYKLAYAFAAKGVSYVYIKGAESELLAQKDMPELTDLLVFDMTVGKFSFAPAAFNASVEGNKYIYEQLCNTIVISCHHEYDSDCDDTCNKCEEKRYVEDHIYDTVCDAYCNVCGAEREAEDHKYDNACDKTCNVCGAERTPADHDYDNDCDVTCNVCGAERTPSAHEYDNECDEICNECEEKRIVIHVYESDCDVDCDRCGADRYPREHIFGDWVVVKEATVDEDGMRERTCSVCNHKESRVISKQTAVTSNDQSDGSDDGIPTVVIVLIAVSVAVAAGGAVVFIVKKKILL